MGLFKLIYTLQHSQGRQASRAPDAVGTLTSTESLGMLPNRDAPAAPRYNLLTRRPAPHVRSSVGSFRYTQKARLPGYRD